MFSIGEISALQAGQFSTQTLLLRSHAVVIAAVCGFALSCWNTHRLEGSICCSKTFIPFSIHSAFQVMQAAHTVCTYAPPYHQRCWLFNWTLIIRWKVSLPFRGGLPSRCPWFPTRLSNFYSSDHRTFFHLSLMPRDFSSFSESFDDVLRCRWWDLQSFYNLTLRNIVFNVFQNLFTRSFTDWRASAHLYFLETLPLSDISFMLQTWCKIKLRPVAGIIFEMSSFSG